MVVPGRRFGKPWLAIYKYNHLCYVEIFGNQKGEDCRKIETEKWKYLEGEKVSNMVVVVCPLQPSLSVNSGCPGPESSVLVLSRWACPISSQVTDYWGEPCNRTGEVHPVAPNDTAYKRWSCHSGLELRYKLCRTFPSPTMRARFTVFWACRPC